MPGHSMIVQEKRIRLSDSADFRVFSFATSGHPSVMFQIPDVRCGILSALFCRHAHWQGWPDDISHGPKKCSIRNMRCVRRKTYCSAFRGCSIQRLKWQLKSCLPTYPRCSADAMSLLSQMLCDLPDSVQLPLCLHVISPEDRLYRWISQCTAGDAPAEFKKLISPSLRHCAEECDQTHESDNFVFTASLSPLR